MISVSKERRIERLMKQVSKHKMNSKLVIKHMTKINGLRGNVKNS